MILCKITIRERKAEGFLILVRNYKYNFKTFIFDREFLVKCHTLKFIIEIPSFVDGFKT